MNGPERSKVKDLGPGQDGQVVISWTTRPGNSRPPESVPTCISVIVTSSIERDAKGSLGGTIVGHAILRVDSPYRDDPGKPVFGVVVAVTP